jgi:hypothetical protein
MFGASKETTYIGLAGLGICGGCIWLGLAFKNDTVLGLGVALLPLILAALGLTSRSQAEHERDKKEGKT